jgi:hypothetical protein
MKLLKHAIPALAVSCIILLVLASGCGNISADTVKGKHFGNTFEASPANVKAMSCFTNIYGDLTAKGDPRFIEPLITTGLDQNNLPVNNVVKFPANQDPIYFFVIYDNFKKDDEVTVTWMFSSDTSKEVAKVVNKTADDYGRFIITFQKPDGGWNEGTNMIQVTSTYGTQKTIIFTVGGNTVETQPLTCSDSSTGSASSVTTTASVAQAAASVCPNVWGGTWDTRWNSYSNENDIVDMVSGADDWNSYVASPVTMTQNDCGVTGTIHFLSGSNPECIGTFTTTVDKNNPNQLTGKWTTTGCEAEPGQGYTGDFTLTMANDKKSWIGKMISAKNDYRDNPDWQNNWAGRLVASSATTGSAAAIPTITVNPGVTVNRNLGQSGVPQTPGITPKPQTTFTIPTPACPSSIWGGNWDTRWNSYSNENDIVDMVSGADDWNSYVASPATMTQNCWGVTGTIHFLSGSNPECIGTITGGTIDKNDPNHLTGGWVTTGCEAESGQGYTGDFSLTMANDQKSWIGKMISAKNDYRDNPDWQNNWAGRRV